ncbi:MAG: hypothetical protein U5R48_02475 [Gammaproteobacteria bacterium]|nr:hypothetical protein [Gammaproteobacteria bacterium]
MAAADGQAHGGLDMIPGVHVAALEPGQGAVAVLLAADVVDGRPQQGLRVQAPGEDQWRHDLSLSK